MLRLSLKLLTIFVLFLSINSSSLGNEQIVEKKLHGRMFPFIDEKKQQQKIDEINRRWNEKNNLYKKNTDIQLSETETPKETLPPIDQGFEFRRQQVISEKQEIKVAPNEPIKNDRKDFIHEVLSKITPEHIEEWKAIEHQWERTFDLKDGSKLTRTIHGITLIKNGKMIFKKRESIRISQNRNQKRVELNLDMSEKDFWHKLKDFDSYMRTKEETVAYEDWLNWESSDYLILKNRYFTEAIWTDIMGEKRDYFNWLPVSYPKRPLPTLSIHGSKNVITFDCYNGQLFMHDFEGTLDNGKFLHLSISMSRAEWEEALIQSGLVIFPMIQTRAQSEGPHKYFAGSFEITKYVNDMATKMPQEELEKKASRVLPFI